MKNSILATEDNASKKSLHHEKTNIESGNIQKKIVNSTFLCLPNFFLFFLNMKIINKDILMF
jgi:hypothetical protein